MPKERRRVAGIRMAAIVLASVPLTAWSAEPVEEIVILGRGTARQVQMLGAADIAAGPPGASPLLALSRLPGVNFQAADPFGAYEWGMKLSIRGFVQNQLGYTLDGVPLGDMAYANTNGLHISRAIAPANIARAELSQGAAALDTPSTSNLGGAIRFESVMPAAEPGVLAILGAGSADTRSMFVRLETGRLPGDGRAYVSYDRQRAGKWKGSGSQRQERLNLKAVQPLGEAVATAFLNLSERHETDYQDLSPDLVRRLGWDIDNIQESWETAVALAEASQSGRPLPAPYATVDDVYFDAAGNRRDLLAALSLEAPAGPDVTLRTTAYLHRNQGVGAWFTPYTPTPPAAGGAPISLRTTEYDIDRAGLTGSVNWTVGAHRIEGGFWVEDNDFLQARRFYGLQRAAPGRGAHGWPSDPFRTDWQNLFDTSTRHLWLRDTWRVAPALTLTAGAKSVRVENTSRTLAGPVLDGTIVAQGDLLPQVGLTWSASEADELFAGYTRNMRAFVSSRTDGPFSTTQAGFAAIRDRLEPETTDTLEAGWRRKGADYEALLALYHVRFADRLLATTVGSGIQGNPSALSNVGGVTAQGLETAFRWRPLPQWSGFVSYAWNRSTYDDDTLDGDGRLVVPTAGRTVVDAPRHLGRAEIAYDDGRLSARLGVSAVGRRFYSYSNDAAVSGHATVDATLGWRFGDSEVQLNATNLFDSRHFTGIGSNGFVTSDTAGTFQTLHAAPPRQVFVTLRSRF